MLKLLLLEVKKVTGGFYIDKERDSDRKAYRLKRSQRVDQEINIITTEY